LAVKRDGDDLLASFMSRMARPDLNFLSSHHAIAVGVSGGPDSMALCFLLSRWAQVLSAGGHDVQIHALTVDHDLRPESWQEAEAVHQWLQGWPHIQHHILKWDHKASGGGVDSAVQEKARHARYDLMSTYCAAHDIGALCLGHHGDDQAETVLFRLAKGSGLDGLAGMAARYDYSDSLSLIRPLLGFSKDDLVALCAAENVPSLDDPSNENDAFARVRLREARAALEAEGLTSSRLSVTAMRLGRARAALEELSAKAYSAAVFKSDTGQIVFNKRALLQQPDEIILRVMLMAMERLNRAEYYAPRLERVETILADMIAAAPFRKRTLGGVIFSRDDGADNAAGHIILEREKTTS